MNKIFGKLVGATVALAMTGAAAPAFADYLVVVKNEAAMNIQSRVNTGSGWSGWSDTMMAAQSKNYYLPSSSRYIAVEIQYKGIPGWYSICTRTRTPAANFTLSAKGTVFNKWCSEG